MKPHIASIAAIAAALIGSGVARADNLNTLEAFGISRRRSIGRPFRRRGRRLTRSSRS